MATLTCESCQTSVDASAAVCDGCGFPIFARPTSSPPPRERTEEQCPQLEAETQPPLAPRTAPTAPTNAEACDHSDGSRGVLCTLCGQPRPPASVASDRRTPGSSAATGVTVALHFPWGIHRLDPGDELDIGREVGPFVRHLCVFDTVGRRHATLRVTARGRLVVTDHRSTNGTFIDGRRCETGETEVPLGAELRFSSALRVTVETP